MTEHTAAAAAAEDSIRALMTELQAMEDTNAEMYSPLCLMDPFEHTPPPPPPPMKKKRSKKNDLNTQCTTTTSQNNSNNGWEMRQANDAPFIKWTDAGFEYTVQNPTNCGNLLLKIQMFNHGRPINSCGLYLNSNEDKKICNKLKELINLLENMWVDRNSGVSKVDCTIQSAVPLSSWRVISKEEEEGIFCKASKRSSSSRHAGVKKTKRNTCMSRQ